MAATPTHPLDPDQPLKNRRLRGVPNAEDPKPGRPHGDDRDPKRGDQVPTYETPDTRTEDEKETTRAQVRHVIEALGGPKRVRWYPPRGVKAKDSADFEHIARVGYILVRDYDLDRVLRVLPGTEVADSLIDRVTLLRLPPDVSVDAALERVDTQLGEGIATPDHVFWVTKSVGSCCPATEPEEPTARVPAPALSKDGGDGAGVLVNVVDTGWFPDAANHADTPWLTGVLPGSAADIETIDPNNIHPYAGHGTFIAGLIKCVAPAADVVVDGFLPKGGGVFESEITVQLYQALSRGADIINLSAGAYTRNAIPPLGFIAFYETGLRHYKGTVLVAAAGNDGGRRPFWPAGFPWSLSVGALTEDGKSRAKFSNFGSWVDVYAVGENLVNAYPSGRFVCQEAPNTGQERHFDGLAQWSGTSFSAPTVAAIIAGRMSQTGESARAAADALLGIAAQSTIAGIGATISPGPQNLT